MFERKEWGEALKIPTSYSEAGSFWERTNHSLSVWPVIGYPGFIGCLHIYEHTGSTDWAQWVTFKEKEENMKLGRGFVGRIQEDLEGGHGIYGIYIWDIYGIYIYVCVYYFIAYNY